AHLGAACEDEQRQRLCLEERQPRVAREHRIRKAERDHPEPERRHRAEAVTEHPTQPSLGVARGAALYVGALIGPGVLLVPALAANAFGLRVSSGFQLVLASVLVVVIACAIAIALPSRGGDNWTPFAPHGWWAIGTSANILVWLFVGWEAVAQLAGDFRRPESDLPRSMALAFGIVTVLYCRLAAATVAVTAGTHSRVPLADLIAVGFGRAGRDATAVLAVALTMGTMNVYIGGPAELAASLASDGALPLWLARDAPRSVPRRPLLLIAAVGARA